MDWQIVFTLGVVALALAAMIRELAPPDLVLMAALICFGATGILSPSQTFAGFANPVVATVGALFIVSAALRETGALDRERRVRIKIWWMWNNRVVQNPLKSPTQKFMRHSNTLRDVVSST